jgi:hypothetical protein
MREPENDVVKTAYLSQAAAAFAVDAENPPSGDTLNRWHDRMKGPRTTGGRRVWTSEICAEIREARVSARKAAAA